VPICEQCGVEHPVEELELSFRRPDAVAALSQESRSERVQENKDLCVLDGQRFFVRALLPLQVIGRATAYNVGVWVEVARPVFERIYELWDAPEQSLEPSFAAAFANDIPTHPQTIGLKAQLSLTGSATVPEVTLHPAGHPLVSEQVNGITPHRAYEYSSLFAKDAA
jgi:hypothetical protein